MCVLTELYGLDPGDHRLREKVKTRLMSMFEDKLAFITVDYHSAQLVICKSSVTKVDLQQFLKDNDTIILKRGAKIMRDEIKKVIDAAETIPWPPNAESLARADRQPPDAVLKFVTGVLHDEESHHSPPDTVKRSTHSIAEDLVFCYSKGTFLTQKHVLVGKGLHSMTGQKAPVTILSELGHCIKYDELRAIEAGQAELASQIAESGYELPLKPATEDDRVPAFFGGTTMMKRRRIRRAVYTSHTALDGRNGALVPSRDLRAILRSRNVAATNHVKGLWRPVK